VSWCTPTTWCARLAGGQGHVDARTCVHNWRARRWPGVAGCPQHAIERINWRCILVTRDNSPRFKCVVAHRAGASEVGEHRVGEHPRRGVMPRRGGQRSLHPHGVTSPLALSDRAAGNNSRSENDLRFASCTCCACHRRPNKFLDRRGSPHLSKVGGWVAVTRNRWTWCHRQHPPPQVVTDAARRGRPSGRLWRACVHACARIFSYFARVGTQYAQSPQMVGFAWQRAARYDGSRARARWTLASSTDPSPPSPSTDNYPARHRPSTWRLHQHPPRRDL